MTTRRNLAYVMGIVALLVLPTVMSLTYYQVSKDPNARPLAVTEQSLRAFVNGKLGVINIIAQVDWVPGHTSGFSQPQLEKAIVNAFRAKGVEVDVRFRQGVDHTRISYLVGKSTIGPYSTSRAAEGISAAVEAYRMYVPLK